MQNKSQKVTCQNHNISKHCQGEFIIEPDDFVFYDKIKVPPPTFCPECRRQRRLAWMNLFNLYKRDCNICKQNFVSMYSPESPYNVFCPKCWWSDDWDWKDYGQDFDESKTFFEQFNELLHKIPLCGLSINTSTALGSPYNNHAQDLKNCYLTFLTSYNEDSACGVLVTRNKEVFNCSMVMDCDSCFDCMNIFKSSRCVGTRGNARFCLEGWFNRDCDNCTECIGCVNLKNKSYCIFNTQYTKEEYFKIKNEIDLGSWKQYQDLKKKAGDFWVTFSPKPMYDDMSIDYKGSYVFKSKNCKDCYDVTGAENSKYLLMMYNEPTKDCYDISSWGGNLSFYYEGNIVGENSSELRFCQETGIGNMDAEYCKLVFNSSHVFGSVSVKKGEYVILNKTYSKEKYFELRKKIIENMNKNPYINSLGNVYKYGEFFPLEIAPFPYNKTIAQFFNPLNENEIINKGLVFEKDKASEHIVTLQKNDLPDNIKDINDSILKEVICCEKCSKGYRIIEMELVYLRKMNLPLPRICPFCRINEQFSLWVENMHLHARVCDKCDIEFNTHYSKERAPVVYCKKCYQQEIY